MRMMLRLALACSIFHAGWAKSVYPRWGVSHIISHSFLAPSFKPSLLFLLFFCESWRGSFDTRRAHTISLTMPSAPCVLLRPQANSWSSPPEDGDNGVEDVALDTSSEGDVNKSFVDAIGEFKRDPRAVTGIQSCAGLDITDKVYQ